VSQKACKKYKKPNSMDYYTLIQYFEQKLVASNAHWDLEIDQKLAKAHNLRLLQ
jgi:hypothetical protein